MWWFLNSNIFNQRRKKKETCCFGYPLLLVFFLSPFTLLLKKKNRMQISVLRCVYASLDNDYNKLEFIQVGGADVLIDALQIADVDSEVGKKNCPTHVHHSTLCTTILNT